MKIIGISSHYHNSAVSLFDNGLLVAAAEEERFSRKKFDSSFPKLALNSILKKNNLIPSDIDLVCYYEQPEKKLERQFDMFTDFTVIPYSSLISQSLVPELSIQKFFGENINIKVFNHHHSHIAFSFYSSGLEESVFLVADAVGEKDTISWGLIDKTGIKEIESTTFPNSLGMFYSAITEFLGFRVNSDEYKVMGLTAYGKAKYKQEIIKMFKDTSLKNFELNMEYFDFQNYNHKNTFSDKMKELLNISPRNPNEQELEKKYIDIATSTQSVLEDIMIGFVKELKSEYPTVKNLCLGGGVSLNSVANMKIRDLDIFEKVYIPPSPGDAGSAIGCAYLGQAQSGITIKKKFTPYLGDEKKVVTDYSLFGYSKNVTHEEIADLIIGGAIVGVFQGRSEFGPRALGNRSIIADPSIVGMKDKLNLKVKNREEFRPFAPIIMEEHASEYFHHIDSNEYMTMTYRANEKAIGKFPEVVHMDSTARIQTVSIESNKWLYKLLSSYEQKTGSPTLINTSFNLSDEPIVETDLDAIFCFLRSEIDYLVIGEKLLDKSLVEQYVVDNAIKYYKNISIKLERNSYSF